MLRGYRAVWGGFALWGLLGIAVASAGACRIEVSPPVHVTVKDLRAMVWARINGRKARFLIDTGAFWSMLSPQARRAYHLSDIVGVTGLWLKGFDGYTAASVTTVGTFTFLHVPFRNAEFLVGANDFPSGAVGLLGGSLLRLADVEYDFGDGLMRFVDPKHCGGVPLAYWAKGQNIGAVKLRRMSARHPFLIGHARVNGRRIRVLFDTGTPRSIMSLRAARRAGITLHSPGVRPAGRMYGVARKWLKAWAAPVAVFSIGNETIEHTRMLISNFNLGQMHIGLVLGADFFLSHHIIVAQRRHMLYFTYNGGPVFDLGHRYLVEKDGAAPVRAGPGATLVGASATAASSPRGSVSMPAAAAGRLMRRGMALAGEGQYRRALFDLNRACALDPSNVEYRFRRGKVYWADRQPKQALADFDAVIARAPNLYQAHLARAQLLLGWKDAPKGSRVTATTDINIASLLAPDASIRRLQLAELYARIGQYPAALRAVNLWIYYHRRDALLPLGWNTRCWVRAEADTQLHEALRDCDRALGRLPQSAAVRDSLGLVDLRLRELKRSVRNFNAALRIKPKLPTALYGRALAELAEGEKAAGEADLAAAKKADPGVTRLFAHMHLAP